MAFGSAVCPDGRLETRRQVQLDRAAAAVLGAMWKHSSSWRAFPLEPVLELADEAGVAICIRDRAGVVVGASPDFGSLGSRGEFRKPVVVGTESVR